jgi:hypothetical protein
VETEHRPEESQTRELRVGQRVERTERDRDMGEKKENRNSPNISAFKLEFLFSLGGW